MDKFPIAVLTTETLHHLWFLRQIMARCREYVDLRLVVVETKPFPWKERFWQYAKEHRFNPVRAILFNPYLHLPYREKERRRYEENLFFPFLGQDPECIWYAYEIRRPDQDLRVAVRKLGVQTEYVLTINAEFTQELLRESQAQLAICYGTGRVLPAIFNVPPLGTINLHGGILPEYRGLDTNLWAAFEGKPNRMGVTIHQMDAGIDTGPVYYQKRLPPAPDLSAVTLRYHTTVRVTEMVCDILKMAYQGSLGNPRHLPSEKSRYYPPMPFLYKPLADWRIRQWAKRSNP